MVTDNHIVNNNNINDNNSNDNLVASSGISVFLNGSIHDKLRKITQARGKFILSNFKLLHF